MPGRAGHTGRNIAALLAKKADSDFHAAKALLGLASVADETFGFHLQQTVERTLKAMLASRGVQYPFTHDIDDLVSELGTHGVQLPVDLDDVAQLTPFAEELRYEQALPATKGEMDRRHWLDVVERFRKWAATNHPRR